MAPGNDTGNESPSTTSESSPLPLETVRPDSPAHYLEIVRRMKDRGARFISLWGSWPDGDPPTILSAFFVSEGLLLCRLPLPPDSTRRFPSISFLFPLANRPERTVRDLYGLEPDGLADNRPWLDHGLWRRPPMMPDNLLASWQQTTVPTPTGDYPFVAVEGEGVHEIPVGPVHAGIIEPGHFRFQVVGEKVLRMEARLGYCHKGIRALLRQASCERAQTIVSRISGDSAAAYQISFAEAVENASDRHPPPRALWIRAILLERERIANHLGDLGALGNDAGFGFGGVQFGRLKEEMLRINALLFEHRYLMETIIPGGVARDLTRQACAMMGEECKSLRRSTLDLKTIYNEHGGLQDRFAQTGWLDPMLAGEWGLGGVVGRASGQFLDLRHSHPSAPYDRFPVPVSVSGRGDVSARVQVRFHEILHALSFLESLLVSLPETPLSVPPSASRSPREGIGMTEGWRGEVLTWVRLGPDGSIIDAHVHDPSWLLWPALEQAVPGNLVADFPLINKSFNLSYSGHDL